MTRDRIIIGGVIGLLVIALLLMFGGSYKSNCLGSGGTYFLTVDGEKVFEDCERGISLVPEWVY